MANQTLITSNVTFLDYTDLRKLEVYISSNLPQTQIFNPNNTSYSPDWSSTALELMAEVYLDYDKITPETIIWYEQIGNGTKTKYGNGANISINANKMTGDNAKSITYICEVTYQNTSAFSKIVFTRVDTGLNGSNGKDGTSVTILGSYNTLSDLQVAHPIGKAGDSYIVDGDLYVWVVNNAMWENVGSIEGPAGKDGQDAKSIILNADAQVFKVSKTGEITPKTITLTSQEINTIATSWTYSTNGGQTFLSISPDGISRNGNIVTITGADITSNMIIIKASDGTYSDTYTIYKVFDGVDGATGQSASIAFLTNENITFSANQYGQISTTSFITNVVAYNGTTKVTPAIGSILDLPNGITIDQDNIIDINNELMLTFTVTHNSTLGSPLSNSGTISIPVTSPVNTVLTLSWSKVNTGATGAGISSVTVTYGESTSASTQPTEWQSSVPDVAEGSYLWTRTITDYTDVSIPDTVTYTYAKQGVKGDTGSAGSSVTVSKIEYQSGTSATTAPTGTWSNVVVIVADGDYLWTKTTFSDGKVAYGVARQGVKGDQGIQGPKGNDAYTVMLTNESHIFAGDISNAIAGTAETQVLAYNGSTAQSVTIVSVNNKNAATTDTDTGITGLKFKCSALSGTSPKITFTCTTSFVSKSGSIPIVLSVGGVQFTKMFTYSIAFKGATGAQGGTGTPASLVDITPSALYFKSTTGKDGTFTPDYIYLYPRFQTVTFSKWEYSVNGGTTWVAASGANGLTISTYNSVANTLRIAKTSTLYTDTVTSISFRCVSSNTSVYDTVSIAKIYDVVDLQIGGTNLLTNSGYMTNLNGWTVYSNTYPVNDLKLEVNDIYGSVLTATGTATNSRIRVGQYIPYLQKANRTLTFSMVYQASVDSTLVTAGGKYSESDNSSEYGSFAGTNIKRTDLGNGFTYMETTFNLTYTEATRSFFVYIYPGVQTTKIVYCKLEDGNKATAGWTSAPEDLKTFQIYAPMGSLLTNEVSEVTLQTFAYEGSREITNATFKWYIWSGEAWSAISGATGASLTVGKTDVMKSNVYKCEMTYLGVKYEATATVEDKTDIYESLIRVMAKQSSTNRIYWVLYTTVYSEDGERDPLLGPISETAPASPTTGAYWYKIDATNYTVTLMKYSGTAWATTTDTQELLYDWFLFKDTTDMITLGTQSKVKIVTANDFSRVCSIQCNIFDSDYTLFSRNSQVLNDPSDPIVSATEPPNPIDKQLWIKIADNGTYIISIWDEATRKWMISEADSQNKVHVEKPTIYSAGDIWIVGGDYQPTIYTAGVAQTTKHLVGTMLKAQFVSSTYSDSDWVEALNYKERIDDLTEQLNVYNQFFDFDETGLTMGAKNLSGQISAFKTKLTNTELGFYQGENKVAYINNNQLNISKAEINQSLSIVGTSPMFSIGDFSFVVESNGSLSIVANN